MIGSVEWMNASLANDYGADHGSNSPSSMDLCLYTTDVDSGGVEFSGAGYSAATVANNGTNFPAPSGGEIVCPPIAVFTPTEDITDVPTWWYLRDGDGNLMDGAPIAEPISGVQGSEIQVRMRISANPASGG